jgi:hypothetical protein
MSIDAMSIDRLGRVGGAYARLVPVPAIEPIDRSARRAAGTVATAVVAEMSAVVAGVAAEAVALPVVEDGVGRSSNNRSNNLG